MTQFFKYFYVTICVLMFLTNQLNAQKTLAGYVYRTSDCASGGNDYYFFKEGKVVIAFAVAGSIYGANATMGSWRKEANRVIITKHYEKTTKPAPDAKVLMVAADTQYDKYVAYTRFFSDENESELLDLSFFEEGQGCESREKHAKQSAQAFFQSCLRVAENQRLYPFASKRLLTKSELRKYKLKELRIMHHELLASYGYLFQEEQWRKYFSQRGIYGNLVDVEAFMTSTERQNLALLKTLLN